MAYRNFSINGISLKVLKIMIKASSFLTKFENVIKLPFNFYFQQLASI